MKFSFEEPHLWKQHALSLLAIGRYNQALLILKEVIRLEPHSTIDCLLAAKLCYEHLNMYAEGTAFSEEALKREKLISPSILGRCHLYIGIGYHLQANCSMVKQEKTEFVAQALEHFQAYVFFYLNFFNTNTKIVWIRKLFSFIERL